MRHLFILFCTIVGLSTLSNCKKEAPDLEITASMENEFVDENKYKFTATTESFDSAVWVIDGKNLRGASVEYTFGDYGSYDVSLKVYKSNEDDKVFNNEVERTLNVQKTYDIVKITPSIGSPKVLHMYLFESTPKHKENFLKLAKEKFYDGTTFHRVVPSFVIQGGDPNSKDNDPSNDGQGGPGYTLPFEASNFTHEQGKVAAARLGDGQNPDKNSSGSQFYIVEPAAGAHQLDGDYTIFGELIEGTDLVSQIANVESTDTRPNQDVTMKVVTIIYEPKRLFEDFGYSIPLE